MGHVMADAFLHEPNFGYVLPNDNTRHRALAWFFGTFVSQLGFRRGAVYATDGSTGQAVWIAPGQKVGLWAAAQAGFFTLPFRFGIDGLARFMKLGSHVEELRSETAPVRHWYLMALGVSPSEQGQGSGSALLKPLLLQADKEQTACYLETFSERNLAFYRNHGFEVTRQSQVKAGPVFWGMVRPAKGGTAK